MAQFDLNMLLVPMIKQTYKLPHESLGSYSDTDNYITKLIMIDDSGGSEFEPQNYKLPDSTGTGGLVMDASTVPYKVMPKELNISGSRVYDSSASWPDSGDDALNIVTGVSGESLQYSDASTKTEHATDTYILDITLGDAVGAVRQTDAAYDESTTAVGFLTDYTFSDEELWDGSTTDLLQSPLVE